MNPEIGALLQQLIGYGAAPAIPAAAADTGTPTPMDLSSLVAGGAAQPSPISGPGGLVVTNPYAGNELNNVASNLNSDSIIGGNENQMQAGAQTGQFSTVDQNATQQSGVTSSQLASLLNSLTNTAQSGASTTGQTGLSSTAQGTTGASTTTPIDTLGMGALLQGQQGAATNTTGATNAALSQIATQGNPYLQQQTNQAVSNALSGPGMEGTGNAAQGRAAGNAAAQVAQNSVGNQLQAASQLSGPTALTTLAGAANPYIGSSTGTAQNTQGTQANTSNTNTATSGNTTTSGTQAGTQSSLGQSLQDVLGTSTSNGTAAGSSASTAAGNVPTSSTSSGGCYVCSALASKGVLGKRSIRAAVRFKLWNRKDRLMAVGYSVYGPWLARAVLKFSSVQRLLTPIAKLVLYEELRLTRGFTKFRLDAWMLHALFHTASTGLGAIAAPFFVADTRDPKIRALLAREGLLIETKF